MDFNALEFREYMKLKQYRFSERDEWIAHQYSGKLTFNEVQELKICALKQTLIKYNVKVITDIPWGKGLLEYRHLWEEMMIAANKERDND